MLLERRPLKQAQVLAHVRASHDILEHRLYAILARDEPHLNAYDDTRWAQVARYDTLPKAMPGESRDPDSHDRIRHDRVDKAGSVTIRHNGRLHHLGIGRTHAGTCVILLVQDLHIRVINTITGELLRDLILNPNIDYQPTGRPKGPSRK